MRSGRPVQYLVAKFPTAFPVLLAALDRRLEGGREVAIAGDPNTPATKALIAAARTGFHPNQVLIAGVPGPASSPLLKDKRMMGGQPTAYVCERRVCQFPTTDPAIVARQVAVFTPLK